MADAWTVTSAVATAIAAIAAMAAAGVSLWQVMISIGQSKEARKEQSVLRVFDYSPYASESVLAARLRLGQRFSGLKRGEVLDLAQAKTAFEDKKTLADFNLVLAHWGRFATARKYRLVDPDVSRDLLRFGFLRFWSTYMAFLNDQFANDGDLANQYQDVRALYKEWSKEV